MTTKYLDLDALVSHDITVRLNGTDHKFKEMSVEDFIWAQKKSEIVESTEVESEQIATMIEIIQRSFPTIAREALMKMAMQQLTALADFVLGLSAPKSEKLPVAEGESGKELSPTANP